MAKAKATLSHTVLHSRLSILLLPDNTRRRLATWSLTVLPNAIRYLPVAREPTEEEEIHGAATALLAVS